jgi:hypothetical protein
MRFANLEGSSEGCVGPGGPGHPAGVALKLRTEKKPNFDREVALA